MIPEELRERVLKIKAVILDVDGVLTDGRLMLGNYGDELKFFDIHDGFGIQVLRQAGFKTAMITGRKSRINERRAKELKVPLFQKVKDKLKVYEKLLKKFGLEADETCYMGDDIPDIPVLRRAGFAVAVDNAVEEVKRLSHYVTQKKGGRGAVREVTELILKLQNKWEDATRSVLLR